MITSELITKYNQQDIIGYTLTNNNNVSITIMNYGATILKWMMADRDGNIDDIILGYDEFEYYLDNGMGYGSVIGPNCNRIAKGEVTIDDVTYQLQLNNNGNNLHTHSDKNLRKRLMDCQVDEENNKLVFSCMLEDGYDNLPGNREVSISYQLTEENELIVTYCMKSDKKTIFNPTQHTYFNLNGQDGSTVENHWLYINADFFTENDKQLIPTGEVLEVDDSVMDLRVEKELAECFEEKEGFDDNWVLNRLDSTYHKNVACLSNYDNGRCITISTDMPGLQVYTHNGAYCDHGKNGTYYPSFGGIALETQYFPDCVNHPDFDSSIIEADTLVEHKTIFKMDIEAE